MAAPSTSWTPQSAATGAWSANSLSASVTTDVSLSRTSTGLVAWSLRSADNDGSISDRSIFRASHWQAFGQNADVATVVATGELEYAGPLFNLHNTLRNVNVGLRAEYLVQARVKNLSASGPLLSGGPSVRVRDTGNTGSSTVQHVGAVIPLGVMANHGISEYHDGNTDLTPSFSSQSLAQSTLRRVTVWCDATDKAMHDHDLGVTRSAAIAQAGLTGRPGLNFRDASDGGAGAIQCAEWLACRSRYLQVSGASLTDGWIVNARRSGASAIASATVSNASARIDLLAQTLDGGIVDITVSDAQGNVLGTLTPGGSGLWPGDIVEATVTVTGEGPTSWSTQSTVSTTWTSL